jgi:putative exporter of polyketide antibiotics
MYIYAVVIGVLADQTVLTISQSLWASTVIWPVIALTVALSAGLLVWVPRVLPVIWLWVVANGAIAVFNDLWKLPDSVLQWLPLVYSPHVLIGQAVTSYSWVVLAVAIGLSIAAGWGWQRRDMGR